MNTDNIDSSQWLPRNSPVVNPFRMAQGDLDGKINSRGEVIGTNTWGINDSEFGFYNVATSTNALCELLEC